MKRIWKERQCERKVEVWMSRNMIGKAFVWKFRSMEFCFLSYRIVRDFTTVERARKQEAPVVFTRAPDQVDRCV